MRAQAACEGRKAAPVPCTCPSCRSSSPRAAPAGSAGWRGASEDSVKGRNQITHLSRSPLDCPTTCGETLQQPQIFKNRIKNKRRTANPPAEVPQQPSTCEARYLGDVQAARLASTCVGGPAPQVLLRRNPTRSAIFPPVKHQRPTCFSTGGARKSLNEELHLPGPE